MDEFRKELTSLVDGLLAEGRVPIFLMVDLVGAEYLRRSSDAAALENFRDACMSSLSSTSGGAATFSYGDIRIVAILHGFDRLKTFALVEKMRRMLPLLAQSFDCVLAPEFDTIEYEEHTGVPGIINQIVAPRPQLDVA
jgi:hypothetical protein